MTTDGDFKTKDWRMVQIPLFERKVGKDVVDKKTGKVVKPALKEIYPMRLGHILTLFAQHAKNCTLLQAHIETIFAKSKTDKKLKEVEDTDEV